MPPRIAFSIDTSHVPSVRIDDDKIRDYLTDVLTEAREVSQSHLGF